MVEPFCCVMGWSNLLENMFDRDAWLEIANTVLSNPLRTGLTGLSIALGMFILVVMQGLGFGLQNGVEAQFNDDAINSIWIRPGNTTIAHRGRQSNRPIIIHESDAEAAREVPDEPLPFSRRLQMWSVTMESGREEGKFMLRGVDPSYQELEKTQLTSGRFISQRDLDESRKVVVVGENIVKELFKGRVRLGTELNIFGSNYTIVGSFQDPGGRWENNAAYIPFTAMQERLGWGDNVGQIVFSTGDQSLDESRSLTSKLTGWLKDRLAIHPDDRSALNVTNNNEEFGRYAAIFSGIRLFIWAIGLMTLLAGAVSVANIMAIVVKERTKEIGVRKALGATNSSIVGLIVQEATALMLLSGLAGLAASVLLLEWVAPQIDHEYFKSPQVDLNVSLTALFLLVVVGVLSGTGPAIRAVRIRPVEALRAE